MASIKASTHYYNIETGVLTGNLRKNIKTFTEGCTSPKVAQNKVRRLVPASICQQHLYNMEHGFGSLKGFSDWFTPITRASS